MVVRAFIPLELEFEDEVLGAAAAAATVLDEDRSVLVGVVVSGNARLREFLCFSHLQLAATLRAQ